MSGRSGLLAPFVNPNGRRAGQIVRPTHTRAAFVRLTYGSDQWDTFVRRMCGSDAHRLAETPCATRTPASHRVGSTRPPRSPEPGARSVTPGDAPQQPLRVDRPVTSRVDASVRGVADEPRLGRAEHRGRVTRTHDPVARSPGEALHHDEVAAGLADDDERPPPRPAGSGWVHQQPIARTKRRDHAQAVDLHPPRPASGATSERAHVPGEREDRGGDEEQAKHPRSTAPAGGSTPPAHREPPPARAGACPAGIVGYFLVAQNMSANSLVAASRSAAACASMPCLFLPASLSRFQTLVWRSGNAARCSALK